MRLLLVFLVSEIVAVLLVVAMCMAARRGDRKTERSLSADETEARQIVSDKPSAGEYAAPGEAPVGRGSSRGWRGWRRNRHSG